jgi:hypothetical protein
MAQQLNLVKQTAINILKNQRIIQRPRDLVLYTQMENHPSLYKPDDVVYAYEHVMDQFKFHRRINFSTLKTFIQEPPATVEYNYAEENAFAEENADAEEYGPVNIIPQGYGSNYNGGYDSY